MLSQISHLLHNSMNLELANCVLLSVMRIFGILNLINIFLLTKQIVYSKVIE